MLPAVAGRVCARLTHEARPLTAMVMRPWWVLTALGRTLSAYLSLGRGLSVKSFRINHAFLSY